MARVARTLVGRNLGCGSTGTSVMMAFCCGTIKLSIIKQEKIKKV
jgi:hypothetical protein